jgi:class 3 adenylate cyclase
VTAKTGLQPQIPDVITQIAYPAYMVSRSWDIEWINAQAEELIFGYPIRKVAQIEDRHFFKLLFVTKALDLIGDFENFVRSHLSLVQGDIPSPAKNPLLVPLGTQAVDWLQRIWPEDGPPPPAIDYREEQVRFKKAPVERYHRVAASFREGVLVIWIPATMNLAPMLDLLTGRQNVISDLLMNKLPAMKSMAVLVADLQSSVKICADLPPEEYFELITEMWSRMEQPFREHGGAAGKHVGDGVVRYFLAGHDSAFAHIVNALLCADAIRRVMEEINASWKSRKHWLNNLVLNVGLHEGREWFGYLPTLPTPEFTALGDTVNITARLSGHSRDGAIWATKHFLSSLPAQILEHVAYGIRRPSESGELFIPRTYSRVLDLPDRDRVAKSADIANLSVTEVVRLDMKAIRDVVRSTAPAEQAE